MKIGMIGLGKMGLNMTLRLLRNGHNVVVFDLDERVISLAKENGATSVSTLSEFSISLANPRLVWLMLPSGQPTEDVMIQLSEILSPGDVIIDGGNSNYKDSIRRGEFLKHKEIHFMDIGTSGGIWGLENGYCMMIGGDKQTFKMIKPILSSLAPSAEHGWGHVGPTGSGHFVKMIHNGIEYGMMQAYAEGFEILHEKRAFGDESTILDLHKISEIWRYGSVIRSWLLDLTANALEEDGNLSEIEPWVADSGEGRWTVFEAIDLDVPAPVITSALQARFVSRQEESFSAKLLAAMRLNFGGHKTKLKK